MISRNIFRLKHGEWPLVLVALAVFTALNVLTIYKYFNLFTQAKNVGFWSLFFKNFHVSGFDAFSYIELSNAKVYFETVRHPLFYSLLYPFYLLNDEMMSLFDVNLAMFIMAFLLIVCAIYSFLFFYRLLSEVIGVSHIDAIVLCMLFFSFAHVMLTVMVPDHFCLSMFLLLLTLYLSGIRLKARRPMKNWQTTLLFFLTAGITLTNGVKTIFAAWGVNGQKAVFSWRFIVLCVILPLTLLFAVERYQYREIVTPLNETSKQIGEEMAQKDSSFRAHNAEHAVWKKTHNGEMVDENIPLLKWTDVSTSRPKTVVENLFGESVVLHRAYLLCDVQQNRPIFVPYRTIIPYVVVGLLILLFVTGAWCGRHERLFRICMCWFLFDMFMHLGFGFGINEVYIMAAHWIFIVPIAIAYLLKRLDSSYTYILRTVLIALALGLWIYNGSLIFGYMV